MTMPPREKLQDIPNIVGDLKELETLVLDSMGAGIDKYIHMILIDAVKRIVDVKEREK